MISFRGTGTNTTVREDTDLDGTADVSGTALTDALTNFLKSVVVSGTTLDVQLTISTDNGDDPFAVDNLVVAVGAADITPPLLASSSPFSPSDDATGLALNQSFSVTFDETVQAGTGNITLFEAGGATVQTFDVTADVTFDNDTVSFTPTFNLSASTSYYIQIDSTAIEDLSGNAFLGITDTTTWSFTAGTAVVGVVSAGSTITIEAAGPDDDDTFYAQNSGGGFDEYSLAEFTFDINSFGGVNLASIDTVTLDLTVNDRTFSSTGDFFILFTTESQADLTTTSAYDNLTFSSANAGNYGIDASQYPNDAPSVLGTAFAYNFAGATGGGTVETLTLDVSSVASDLAAAIAAGDSFHIIIGSAEASNGGAAATYSGTGNTFDPGDPTLTITATPSTAPASLVITESNGSTEVTENGATDTIQVALNTIPTDGVDVTLTPANSDIDLGQGAGTPIILNFTTVNAQTNQTVTVTAVNDSDSEGPESTSISISSASNDGSYNGLSDSISVLVNDDDFSPTSGDVIISQYYEGSSNNKYIEITNVGSSPVDLTGYTLVRWGNASAEIYKTASDGTSEDIDTLDLTPLGTIAVGQTFILANSSAASPVSSASADLIQGFPGALTFNGNDSVVLYNSSSISVVNIVDAIGFTNSGNEGANTSFVRVSTSAGWDLASGSNASTFTSIWTEVLTADVDSAGAGTDNELGSSALVTAPPEISFTAGTGIVDEGAAGTGNDTTFDITVSATNTDGTSTYTADVVFNSGNSTAVLADIGNYTTQQVSLTPANSYTTSVTVTITNDTDIESTETASFDLSNAGGGTLIASPSTIDISIQDDDTPVPVIYISEVADPNDDFNARFVELYNPSTTDSVDLNAGSWYLSIYFNDNISVGTDIQLTGSIAPEGTYVIALNESTYSSTYSVGTPDQTGNTNSNGDDTYVLYFGGPSASGQLVDIYGEIGVDGTGTVREFEDGRAVRRSTVTTPNSTFTASEWIIRSDATLLAETTDMTPEVHPDPADVTAPLATLSPLDGATDVAVDSALVLTFNEIVSLNTGNITIRNSDMTLFEQFDVSSSLALALNNGTTLTITPSSNFTEGSSYYVEIDNTAVLDDAGGNSYAGLSGTEAWNFSIPAGSTFETYLANNGGSGSDPTGDSNNNGITDGFEYAFFGAIAENEVVDTVSEFRQVANGVQVDTATTPNDVTDDPIVYSVLLPINIPTDVIYRVYASSDSPNDQGLGRELLATFDGGAQTPGWLVDSTAQTNGASVAVLAGPNFEDQISDYATPSTSAKRFVWIEIEITGLSQP
ncbi:MAG: Ig-like domain-containing protein [Verrucomicrobiota bacterium]